MVWELLSLNVAIPGEHSHRERLDILDCSGVEDPGWVPTHENNGQLSMI